MTDLQLLTFGGAMILAFMRKEVLALVYLMCACWGVLPDEYNLLGLLAMIAVGLFRQYEGTAK